MSKLSGLVAILNPAQDAVVEVRDLGTVEVDVKEGRVRPLVDDKPVLQTNQFYGAITYTIAPTVTRHWQVITQTDSQRDDTALNDALAAEGSVFRALAEIVFGVVKGTIAVTPSLTKAQFIAMLKQRMRT